MRFGLTKSGPQILDLDGFSLPKCGLLMGIHMDVAWFGKGLSKEGQRGEGRRTIPGLRGLEFHGRFPINVQEKLPGWSSKRDWPS